MSGGRFRASKSSYRRSTIGATVKFETECVCVCVVIWGESFEGNLNEDRAIVWGKNNCRTIVRMCFL